MNRTSRPIVVALLIAGCAPGGAPPASSVMAASAEGATVEADKADYSPGETALFSGSGFAPNESIAIHIECSCGCTDELLADADDAGGFAGVAYPITEEHFGAYCSVTAIGSISERVATTSFTDGNVKVLTEPVGVTSSVTVREFHDSGSCGGSASFSAQCPGPSGTCAVSSTLPGATVAAGNNGQSVQLTAAATSNQGGSFSHWTGPNSLSTTASTICVPGFNGGGTATYTAHYGTACAAPSITCPANIARNTDSGTCSAAGVSYQPTVSSACAATVTCTPASPSTFAKGTTTVSCTATSSGGSASCSFSVTVSDNQDPVISCPADAIDECPLDPSTTATASDNCGAPSVTQSSSSTPGSCAGTSTVSRTFTATDASGRTASCTQHVSVVDTTDPTVAAPAGTVVECTADTSPAATGTATGGDSCSSATIGSSDAVVAGCGQTRTITRTWTATDGCGNDASATQVIQTVDTTAPTVAAPADRTVECGGDTSTAATGNAGAADTCGDVTVGHADGETAGTCPVVKTIHRTFTATDACGNPAIATQEISVVDTTPPALTTPADTTVECGDDTSPAATGSATAVDVCSDATVGHVDSQSAGSCPTVRTIHRAWTASDACGNPAGAMQEIAVVDTTRPTVTLSGDAAVEVECATAFDDPGATASDRCQGDLGAATVSGSVDVGTPGSTTLSYGASDVCGNTGTAERVVTVVDTVGPSIQCPADQVVVADCAGSGRFTTATASDACGVKTLVCSDGGGTIGSEAGVGLHHITCVATDLGGQQASCSYDVEVVAAVGDIVWHAPTAADPSNHDTDPDGALPAGFRFKAGQTLPIKDHVESCDGDDITAQVQGFVEVELDSDGNGSFDADLPESYSGVGGAGGQMDHIGGHLMYNLGTKGYTAGTAGDNRSFRLTVSIKRASVLEGLVTVRRESLRLESK